MSGIEMIADLFAGPGARDYLGEAVTIGEHMRQAGALAEAAGAPAPLVAAALLHDVGHLRQETNARRPGGRAVAGPVVRPGGDRTGPAARGGQALPVRHRTPATSACCRPNRSAPWPCRAAR